MEEWSMGLDFAALLRYGGPTGEALEAISDLESGRNFPQLRGVVECGRRLRDAFADHAGRPARWRLRADWDHELPARPALPTLQASLDLPSGFDLTFGRDAIIVAHLVRWSLFFQVEEWHPVLLDAVDLFCSLFDATDCIITSDEHPAILECRDGSTYTASIDTASSRGEGEVATIEEMYIDKGVAEDLVYENPDGTYSDIPLRDSKGFWRPPRRRPRPSRAEGDKGQ
jgi:hypothetical protein